MIKMGLFKKKSEAKKDELTLDEFNEIKDKFHTKKDKLIIDKFILLVNEKLKEKKKGN